MVPLRATCSFVRPSPVLNSASPSRIPSLCTSAFFAFTPAGSSSRETCRRKWRLPLHHYWQQSLALVQFFPVTSPVLHSQRLQRVARKSSFLAGSEKGLRLLGSNGAVCSTVASASRHSVAVATTGETTGAKELPKTFEFSSEERIYNWWESQGYFRPDSNQDGEPFVISMPPPNVTGALHMGHAMFVTLEDIMTRHYRMRGRPTLWLPGTDHAGIATQLVVEKLLASEGVKRTDIGREEFEKRVWDWKRKYGDRITNQLRRLGASCDWERERFTLDENLSAAVREAFVYLHEKGLIYRGSYMVNWSPNLQTAVSDLEVEYSEELGTLYYFKYPVADGNAEDHLPVATTRPETVLGDTAVAVHPEDPRYARFVGKMAVVPMSGGRKIPIIADEYVDMEFGTGALKITPGHDPNDYAIGQKVGLPIINIMNKDGTLNENAGKYSGLDRFVARKQLWADLESSGLAIRKETHTQRVPRSQRGGEVVEPLVSKQWFVTMGPLAEKALKVLESGELRIIPDRFEKIYVQWLTNIKDWCVSRQLWWGHRIPVWYVRGIEGAKDKYIVAHSEEEAYAKARSVYGESVKLEQDPDVLDTWFSSGLWPFSTLGWPNTEAEDFLKFYPTTVLETGHDILFFWVARMVMMGVEFTGKSPFSTVYLHGLVRDAQGRKMSKSLGNVIDPIDTISEYGADALRFTLATGTTPGQDVNLSMERLNANKAFTNKLWNAGKFILQNLPPAEDIRWQELCKYQVGNSLEGLALPERWVITKLHLLIDAVTTSYDKYDFGEVGRALYEFFWSDFADWYIEASKTRLYKSEDPNATHQGQQTLVYVFSTIMKLLHPYMPFVTEELWQAMPHEGDALIASKWPQRDLPTDEQALQQFGDLQVLIRSIRNARAEYSVEPAKRIAAVVVARPEFQQYLSEEKRVLIALAKLDPVTLQIASEPPSEADQAVHLIIGEGLEAYLPLAGMVDIGKEVERLSKQATKLQAEYDSNIKRLSSSKFVDKAPADVVQGVRDKANEADEKLQILKKRLALLESMALSSRS
ncbi:hypothetical protein R1sor_012607 [Riccia sorocarpa]|uniref:valine--tRNA ligase n=1 Tax=Riccia sorocarpa TaxID=122646 RepID=A0ABD3I8C9_9MARC